ncbi:MAG TPA: hypothetical protein VJN21_09975 [Candidatus Acidoferrales bacterium]|nr:hypothetical protein [Candidatus Acidoferrales bacterium]
MPSQKKIAPKIKYSPKAIVIHDASGEILSVGRIPANIPGRIEVKTDMPGCSVLEVELDKAQAAMSPRDLHNTHKLHIPSRKLVRK